MASDNREKKLLLIAGIVVAVLVGDQFVLKPMINGWRSRAERIADLSQLVTRGKQLIDREEALNQRWEMMKASALPMNRSQAETRLLSGMSTWEDRSGVDVISRRPEWRPSDVEELYDLLEIRLNLEGTLEQITRFIHAVESSSLPVRVERFELVRNDDRGRSFKSTTVITGLRLLNTES